MPATCRPDPDAYRRLRAGTRRPLESRRRRRRAEPLTPSCSCTCPRRDAHRLGRRRRVTACWPLRIAGYTPPRGRRWASRRHRAARHPCPVLAPRRVGPGTAGSGCGPTPPRPRRLGVDEACSAADVADDRRRARCCRAPALGTAGPGRPRRSSAPVRVRRRDGEPGRCAAHDARRAGACRTWASIAVAPRGGQGLGAALAATVDRVVLAWPCWSCTLGMYPEIAVARGPTRGRLRPARSDGRVAAIVVRPGRGSGEAAARDQWRWVHGDDPVSRPQLSDSRRPRHTAH